VSRIFTTLAVINMLALLTSAILGLGVMAERDSGVPAPAGHQPLTWGWFASHMVFSLLTAVWTLFVHCLIFTYFLGTGRWVKEVAGAYRLPDQPWPKQTREFKRRAFPPALLAMLAVIAAVASGAGAQTGPESIWGLAHPILAILALAVNGWAHLIEYRTVAANARVMDAVMDEVERRRAASLAS
jgi:amino acid transporter